MNSAVQKRLILSLSVVPAVGLGIMVTIVSIFCNELYQQSLVAQAELDALVPLFLSVSGVSLVTVIVIVASAFQLSHRIAGPMYRVCKSLERIESGDVSFEVGLRDGDHLTDIAVGLNRVLDRLNENPPPGFKTRATPAAADATATTDASVDDVPSPVAELQRAETSD